MPQMKTFRRILSWVDHFSQWQGYFVGILCVALIGMVLYDITARQFGVFTGEAFDIEWFLYSATLMLALGYGVLKGTHVRIDWITTRYSPWAQELIMAISWGLIVIPFMVFVAVFAWKFVMIAFTMSETTTTAWHVLLWPVKLLIFAGIVLMLPQTFVELIRSIYFVIKNEKL